MSTNGRIEKVAKNFVSNTLNVVNKKINDNNIITPSQAETNTLENKKFNLNVRIDGEKIYLSLNKLPSGNTNDEIGFFIDGFEENKEKIAEFLKLNFVTSELSTELIENAEKDPKKNAIENAKKDAKNSKELLEYYVKQFDNEENNTNKEYVKKNFYNLLNTNNKRLKDIITNLKNNDDKFNIEIDKLENIFTTTFNFKRETIPTTQANLQPPNQSNQNNRVSNTQYNAQQNKTNPSNPNQKKGFFSSIPSIPRIPKAPDMGIKSRFSDLGRNFVSSAFPGGDNKTLRKHNNNYKMTKRHRNMRQIKQSKHLRRMKQRRTLRK